MTTSTKSTDYARTTALRWIPPLFETNTFASMPFIVAEGGVAWSRTVERTRSLDSGVCEVKQSIHVAQLPQSYFIDPCVRPSSNVVMRLLYLLIRLLLFFGSSSRRQSSSAHYRMAKTKGLHVNQLHATPTRCRKMLHYSLDYS